MIRKCISALTVLAVALSMAPALPVYAVDPVLPVCQIGDVQYNTLQEALAAIPADTYTTITMLSNVEINTTLKINPSQKVQIDSNFTITINAGAGAAVEVGAYGTLLTVGVGRLNATGYSYGIYAQTGANVGITGDVSATGGFMAVAGGAVGIYAEGANTAVVQVGPVSGYNGIKANNDASVHVEGNVTGVNSAVSAQSGANVEVDGDAGGGGGGGLACVDAYDATIDINGKVTTDLAGSTGVKSGGTSEITVDGNVVAGRIGGYSTGGNIVVLGDLISQDATDAGKGAYAEFGGKIEAGGDLFGYFAGYVRSGGELTVQKNIYGIFTGIDAAQGGIVHAMGNVMPTGAGGIGVNVSTDAEVTVEGIISFDVSMTFGSSAYQAVTPSPKEGYNAYSEGGEYDSYVYVKVPVGPLEPPEPPAPPDPEPSHRRSESSIDPRFELAARKDGETARVMRFVTEIDEQSGEQKAVITDQNSAGFRVPREELFKEGGTVLDATQLTAFQHFELPFVGADLAGLAGTSKEARSNYLTLSTGFGSVSIPQNMLADARIIDGGGFAYDGDLRSVYLNVSISKGSKDKLSEEEKALVADRPIIQLGLNTEFRNIFDNYKNEVRNYSWSNLGAPIKVSMPYAPTAEEMEDPGSITVWYLDGKGKPACVSNGRYDPGTGTVNFSVTHFSQYGVGYNPTAYPDVAADAPFSDAVSYLAARRIPADMALESYEPGRLVSRGECMALLMRALDLEAEEGAVTNFTDAGSDFFAKYLAAARSLEIAKGVGGDRFVPEAPVTRQEMFALLYNALKRFGRLPEAASGKTLADYADAGDAAPWAQEALGGLVQSGIVQGYEGKLFPLKNVTRAEAAQFIYQFLNR